MRSPCDLTVEIVIDEQTPPPEGVSEVALASLVRHVLHREGASGEWEFGIQLLDDMAMQRAHAEFMGIDTPTDIMTFPYEDEGFDLPAGFGGETVQGGDLMISVDRATEHARDAGWSPLEEVQFLVIHGLLHLLGWDDETAEAREQMLTRQRVLLSTWQDAKGG